MTDDLRTDPSVKKLWWLVLVRGILAIILGILAIVAPAAALTGIAIVLGAYFLVNGVVEIVQAVRVRAVYRDWGWMLAKGILSVLAGLAALFLPVLAGLLAGIFVLWTVVFYTLVHGILTISSAKQGIPGRGWYIAGGVVSVLLAIVLGVLLFATPGATLLGFIWVVGVWAIVLGIVLIVEAFKIRA